jgi:hypothetical protein
MRLTAELLGLLRVRVKALGELRLDVNKSGHRPARDAAVSPALLCRSITVMDRSTQCWSKPAISASKSAHWEEAGRRSEVMARQL